MIGAARPAPRAVTLALWWVLATCAGCGGRGAGRGPARTTPEPAPGAYDGSTGAPVTFEAMMRRLEPARVIYVGERHDRPSDHAAQLRVARALLGSSSALAIGFEMFQRPAQPHLDAYQRGELDEAGLLAAAEWEDRWGFDYAMYRPIVRLGPNAGARLVALNTPRELSRAVARTGLEGLDPALAADLPELDLGVEGHRALVEEALASHPHMTPEMLERFYQAQVLWDETMAEAVARTLAGPDAPPRMLVLAGTMHVARSAIPARAARRGAGPFATVVCIDPSELAARLEPGGARADFLWVTGADEPDAAPR